MMAGGKTHMPTRKSAKASDKMKQLVTVRSLVDEKKAAKIKKLPSFYDGEMSITLNQNNMIHSQRFISFEF